MTELNINSCIAIVVNFNAGDALIQSIKALIENDVCDIAIVDNFSSDTSFKTLKNYCQDIANVENVEKQKIAQKLNFEYIHHIDVFKLNSRNIYFIQNNKNLGFAKANNIVLNHFEYDFYALVNPDCIIYSEAISTIIQSMVEDKNIGLSSGIIYNEDETVQVACKRDFPTPLSSLSKIIPFDFLLPNSCKVNDFNFGDREYTTDLEKVPAISGAFMVTSSYALQQVGALDEQYFMHCEDLDWCMRYQNAGFKVISNRHSKVLHIKEVSSGSRPIRVTWYMHRGMIRFFEKFYRQKYSIITRYIVYLGIMMRFVIKMLKTFVQSIIRR